MYRITVNTTGKYNNVSRGPRYCFRKKIAEELIGLFLKYDCDITVEKLIRLSGGIYCFTDCDEGDKVLNYYLDKYCD